MDILEKHSRKQDHSQVNLNQYLVIFHYKINIAEQEQTEISGYSEGENLLITTAPGPKQTRR